MCTTLRNIAAPTGAGTCITDINLRVDNPGYTLPSPVSLVGPPSHTPAQGPCNGMFLAKSVKQWFIPCYARFASFSTFINFKPGFKAGFGLFSSFSTRNNQEKGGETPLNLLLN